MKNLVSVYINARTAHAWRASVKALGLRQGPSLEQALRLWMRLHADKIKAVLEPTPTVRSDDKLQQHAPEEADSELAG